MLEELGFRYAVIGGLAVQHWGHPRFTRDVDLTLLVVPGQERQVASDLTEIFEPRYPDAVQFALENRVLLLSIDGTDLDISFGIPGYEEEVVNNTSPLKIDQERAIHVCSLEDLIIHKAISGRPRDREDLEAVVIRNKHRVDVERVRLWLREFSHLLETEAPLEWFESAYNE